MNKQKDYRNLSNFKDNLLEVLKIKEIDTKTFLEGLGLNKNYLYNTNEHSTLLSSAVTIANKLQLSLDFLCEQDVSNEHQYKTRCVNKFLPNLLSMLKQLKISQRTFCKDLNLSTSCFTRWRNGYLPFLSTITEIANYLECTIDELLI